MRVATGLILNYTFLDLCSEKRSTTHACIGMVVSCMVALKVYLCEDRRLLLRKTAQSEVAYV